MAMSHFWGFHLPTPNPTAMSTLSYSSPWSHWVSKWPASQSPKAVVDASLSLPAARDLGGNPQRMEDTHSRAVPWAVLWMVTDGMSQHDSHEEHTVSRMYHGDGISSIRFYHQEHLGSLFTSLRDGNRPHRRLCGAALHQAINLKAL